MSTGSNFDTILKQFGAISLEEVNKASLMRRKDNKYLFSFRHLPGLLEMISQDYRVLEIDGSRSQQYFTRYFDTDGREMYHKHHRGLANRHKVRIRRYGSGDLHFLEVKKKNAKGVTSKKRVKTRGMDRDVLMKEEEFLLSCSPYEGNGIDLTMENNFNRITLVSHEQTERVTLDYGLKFSSAENGEMLDLPGIAIAEIKFENRLSGSALHAAMRKFRIKPRRFSKYAIGMALLHPDLKQNRFKSKVRKVHQINESYHSITK
ncbi:MAG: polyphosphate polymerase domain-containing protein [Bacteroidales bacterium]|nr:polyphosphate polymerase domain-containing protein [Bacteroidales bacterium]